MPMTLVQLPFVVGIYSQRVKHVNYIDCVTNKLRVKLTIYPKIRFFFFQMLN
jgi:hypothetical protein